MRRFFLSLLALAGLSLVPVQAYPDPEPDSNTPPKGFTALFDGKTLDGWHCPNGKIDSWGAEKGVIYIKKGGGGWLLTKKEYGDFELHVEWKVPKGGNSGVALRTPPKGDPAYAGMEIQILDDASHKGLQKWQATGSIYHVVAASKLATKKVGEWNSYKITCKGSKVTVILNGEKIVDANLDDYKKSHGKQHPGILRTKGHIGFQDHGGRVEFRNVFIKELGETGKTGDK